MVPSDPPGFGGSSAFVIHSDFFNFLSSAPKRAPDSYGAVADGRRYVATHILGPLTVATHPIYSATSTAISGRGDPPVDKHAMWATHPPTCPKLKILKYKLRTDPPTYPHTRHNIDGLE